MMFLFKGVIFRFHLNFPRYKIEPRVLVFKTLSFDIADYVPLRHGVMNDENTWIQTAQHT